MAIFKECGFCEMPSINLDKNGFCKACARCFSVLTQDEIENVAKSCGLKKSAPDLAKTER